MESTASARTEETQGARRPRRGRKSSSIEQFEQRVADALLSVQPGRLGAEALHHELDLVLLDVLAGFEEEAKQAEASAARRSSTNMIEAALRKTSRAHVEALGQAGVPTSVLELLQSWVEVTVDARVVQRQLELQRAAGRLPASSDIQAVVITGPDPAEPLSAAELGRALGDLGDETVRQRERAGELFSVLRPGRKRGREYPAFQAWPGIAGEPLVRILAALGVPGTLSSTAAHGFFTSPTELLGGLTPVETLIGRLVSAREVEPAARELLKAQPQERLAVVLKAAEAIAATHAA